MLILIDKLLNKLKNKVSCIQISFSFFFFFFFFFFLLIMKRKNKKDFIPFWKIYVSFSLINYRSYYRKLKYIKYTPLRVEG